jgi:hypothetical protein
MADVRERKSLLASTSRIQAPWIKVTIGSYTFGVFGEKKTSVQDNSGWYQKQYQVQYPSYVQSLNITKINGQVNQYTLSLTYPIRTGDDPNLIEKILSSVSSSRKIVFSYGDASNPAYVYKDEEALITGVTQSFNMEGTIQSSIQYTIKAVSGAALAASGSFTFVNTSPKKPSDEIKRIFKNNSTYGLQSLFTGMSMANLNKLIDGTDQAVDIGTKVNISPLDYISHLVGCMVPAGTSKSNVNSDIYILTLHDETVFDNFFSDVAGNGGPYFKVTRVSSNTLHRTDAYNLDIGVNSSTAVLSFSLENNENYAMLYNYNSQLSTENYSKRLNSQGEWEQVFAPMVSSGNDRFLTRSSDSVWFTKMTKYPINATVKVQGLLRPANLMQYIRLNVIFPGGNRHISSGLYIVTKQMDDIGPNGYFTTLSLTRISD